eukprot:1558149-Amphidinium_carterae.1
MSFVLRRQTEDGEAEEHAGPGEDGAQSGSPGEDEPVETFELQGCMAILVGVRATAAILLWKAGFDLSQSSGTLAQVPYDQQRPGYYIQCSCGSLHKRLGSHGCQMGEEGSQSGCGNLQSSVEFIGPHHLLQGCTYLCVRKLYVTSFVYRGTRVAYVHHVARAYYSALRMLCRAKGRVEAARTGGE